MFKHIGLALDVFRKGSSVIDAVKAKNRAALAIALGALIALLPTLIKLTTGVEIDLSTEDAAQLGVALATVAGLFSTYGTSDKVGLPAKPEATAAYEDKLFDRAVRQEEQDLRGGP